MKTMCMALVGLGALTLVFLGGALPGPGQAAIGIPNPAAVYCAMLDYDYEIVETDEGQQGMCVFPDDSSCDEWAFFACECGGEYSYCARQGYDWETKTDGDAYSQEYCVCVQDGEEIGAITELIDFEHGEIPLPSAPGRMYNCPEAGKWSIATWRGEDAMPISDALAFCSQQVVAAYRIDPDTLAWTRYFRDRPESSDLTALDDGQDVIALGSGASNASTAGLGPLPPAAAGMLGCPQAGKWAMSVWSGASGTPTDQAVASCTGVAIAAAYWLDPHTQTWSQYFAGRPEISNLTSLSQMQGIITLGGEPAHAA